MFGVMMTSMSMVLNSFVLKTSTPSYITSILKQSSPNFSEFFVEIFYLSSFKRQGGSFQICEIICVDHGVRGAEGPIQPIWGGRVWVGYRVFTLHIASTTI